MTGEVILMKGLASSCLIRISMNLRVLLVTFAVVLLAACGGGSSQNSNSNSSVTMSISPQTVSVSATTTQPAPTGSFQVSVTGLSQGQTAYLGGQLSGQGINQIINNGGTSPVTITIQFESPAALGPGTYDGTVQVKVCLDQACMQQVGNSPQSVQTKYSVTKSTFAIVVLSPSSAYAGAQSFTLTVNGSTFTPQSTILWNGTQLNTTFVNNSQLTAQIPAGNVITAGTATVSVSDPTNGTSNTETFAINPSPITITSLSPANINAEGPAFTLTLTGTSFTAQSTVLWNGNPLTTTFVSATQLTAQIPATNISTPGGAAISVSDPLYGISNSQSFTINIPPLALNFISPATVTVGGPSFTLTVLGTSFTPTSSVELNGVALATTQISPTELIAQVSAGNISATGTVLVLVSDPNSPPSMTGTQTLAIAPPSIDATAFQMNREHTGAVNFSSVSFPSTPSWSVNLGAWPSYALIVAGKVIVTLTMGSNAGSEVVALDQATGSKVWGPIVINGDANAAYDNGRVFVASAPYPGTPPVLQAIDVATGSLDWSTTLNMQTNSIGAPTASNGIVYVDGEYALEALDESTGVLLWTYSGGDGYSTPAVSADGVYASFGCMAYDLRPATGELIWNDNGNCGGGTGTTPAIIDQLDYAPNGALGGNILNAETGANVGQIVAEPPSAYTPTMGYFLEYSTLRGLMLSDNTVQWSFTGDGNLAGPPIAVNQYVLIGSSLGNLYALDGATGALVWNVNVGAGIGASYNFIPYSGLAAGDGLLVVPAGTTITAYVLSTNP